MRILVLLCILCTACDPWFPTEFPVDVHIDSDLTQVQKDKSARAIQEWNEAVGRRVMKLKSNVPKRYRHTFHGTNGAPPGDRLGAAASDPFKCTILLGTTEHIQTIEHEIGHCLGLRHDDHNMFSIMYPTIAVGQFITDDMVEFVLGIMK